MSDRDSDGLEEISVPTNPTRKFALVLLVVVGVCGLGGIGYWLWLTLAVAVEDIDAPVHPSSATTLNGVDVYDVHTELWPQVCYANDNREAGEQAFEALAKGVAGDQRLTELVGDFRKAWDMPLADRAIEQQQLVADWNDYLSRESIPLELQIPIGQRTREGRTLCLLAYAVVAEFKVGGFDAPIHVGLGSREDRINIVEGYLGHASRLTQKAFVTVDRVADESANQLWPLLDETKDEDRDELTRHFASRVRGEIKAQLDPDALETLTKTASSRRALVEIKETLQDRRAVCRSGIVFPLYLPVRGYSTDTIDDLRDKAAPEGTACAPITYDEHERLRDASWELAHTPGMRGAVRQLAALGARGTVVHEVRHVLDQGTELTCEECPRRISEGRRREFSAYLATLAHSPAPFTDTFLMCRFAMRSRGGHGQAARFALSQVLQEGCTGPIPANIGERAREAEQRLLGRSDAIKLPATYPVELPSHRY